MRNNNYLIVPKHNDNNNNIVESYINDLYPTWLNKINCTIYQAKFISFPKFIDKKKEKKNETQSLNIILSLLLRKDNNF